MPIPTHLTKFANPIVKNIHKAIFGIKCCCGNTCFMLTKSKTHHNGKIADDYYDSLKVPVFSVHSAIDKKSGKRYFYGKTFFGIHVGKHFAEDFGTMGDIEVVEIECLNCKTHFVIFDSRYHGYDALAEQHCDPSAENNILLEKKVIVSDIIIKLRYDLSDAELRTVFGAECSEKDLTEAYGSIIIDGIVDEKKQRLSERETA